MRYILPLSYMHHKGELGECSRNTFALLVLTNIVSGRIGIVGGSAECVPFDFPSFTGLIVSIDSRAHHTLQPWQRFEQLCSNQTEAISLTDPAIGSRPCLCSMRFFFGSYYQVVLPRFDCLSAASYPQVFPPLRNSH